MVETSIDQIVSRECESFRAILKADMKSDGTLQQYIIALGQMLKHCGKDPKDLTPQDMESFRQWIAAHYGQNTVFYRITAVNQYTKRVLCRDDLKMEAPAMVRSKKFPLTFSEIRAVQKAADNHRWNLRDRALIDTLYYAALRCDEVAHLRLSSVNFEAKKLMVVCGKGKKDRIVPMAPQLVESLTAYITKERKPKDPSEQVLFVNRDGKPIGNSAVYRLTVHLAHEAGITKRVYPHLFRTTRAKHLHRPEDPKARGLTMAEIMHFLGHTNIATTERYIPISDDDLEQALSDQWDAEQTQQPTRRGPAQVAPRAENVAYATPQHLSHEDILRARLEGKIDTPTMEAMLSHLDGTSVPAATPKVRDSVPYYG